MSTEKNFIVYKASAGSGKTYTLVKEYLKLVLADPGKYRHILAVTFTNKAAYEMKSRIISYLTAISDLNDKCPEKARQDEIRLKYAALMNELSKHTGLNESDLSYMATMVLQRILHNYSDFAISTIDSFVQKIIRTFAYDLKLSQNFEVELDSERVLSEAVDVLLSYAGSDDTLTDMLIEFIKQKIEDGRSWDIESDLKEFSKLLLKEDARKFIGLFSNLSLGDFSKEIGSLYGNRKLLENEAAKTASEIMNIIRENNIELKSFYQGTKGIPGFFLKVLSNGLADVTGNSYCEKAINEDVWYSKSLAENEKIKIDEIKAQISEAYLRIIPMIRKFRDINVVLKSLYPLSLLSQIEKETETIKENENIIFISDFYSKIHEQLLNEPVPFIYQRVGDKYEHYFIDEFQDTSVMQFQNMLPLIENSLASAKTNFIVGDGKQAIYRWRNGEVMQFASLPQIFDKPDLPHFDDIEKSILRNISDYNTSGLNSGNTNYRSKSEIVNFNNNLFDYLANEMLDADKRKIYDAHSQQVKPGNDGGYVQIKFFEENAEYLDNQLNYVFDLVTKLRTSGVSFKDLAVICRSNRQATDIASHLLKNGIDVVSSESLLLGSSGKVSFIVAVFRYLSNPGDDLAAAYILFFLCKNYESDFTFNGLMHDYSDQKKLHDKKFVLPDLIGLFDFHLDFEIISLMPLYDLSEFLIRHFRFNLAPDPFIIYFLDAVNEFVSGEHTGVRDFVEWWDEKGSARSIVVPDKLDAVKVLTIHKAKGLEFPVVIFPFADESATVKGANIWLENTSEYCPGIPAFPLAITQKNLINTSFEDYFDREKSSAALDMLNICYVALTRPEQQLYILTKKYSGKEGKNFGALLKNYLQHIERWHDNNDLYEFGSFTDFIDSGAKSESTLTFVPENISSVDWHEKAVIRYNSSVLWPDDEQSGGVHWGNVIHQILSKIRVKDDIDHVIDETVGEGLLTLDNAEQVRNFVKAQMLNPEFSRFFENGLEVLTEAEILTPENELYRPDRVIFEKDKNIVVDFKTGVEKDVHKTQIGNYADIITEINKKPSEKYLVYLQKELRVIKI